MFAPELAIARAQGSGSMQQLVAVVSVFLVTSIVYALIGGVRRGRRLLVAALAALTAAVTAVLPLLAFELTRFSVGRLELEVATGWQTAIALVASCFASAFVFGAYLALLTRVGLEHTQAFTALDHPGFKHFLRLRVRAQGDR